MSVTSKVNECSNDCPPRSHPRWSATWTSSIPVHGPATARSSSSFLVQHTYRTHIAHTPLSLRIMPLPTQRSPTEPDRMVSGPSIPSSRESTEHSAALEQGTYPDDEVFYREHNTKRPARQTLEADIPRTKEEIKKQIRGEISSARTLLHTA